MTMIAPASPYPTYRTSPEYRQPRITPRDRRRTEYIMRNVRPVDPAHAQALQGRVDQAMKPKPRTRRDAVVFEGRTYT